MHCRFSWDLADVGGLQVRFWRSLVFIFRGWRVENNVAETVSLIRGFDPDPRVVVVYLGARDQPRVRLPVTAEARAPLGYYHALGGCCISSNC